MIEALLRKQEELGLKDQKFADLLGVSRTMLLFVKHGERRPGIKFIRCVIRAFPELEHECVLFFRQNATVSVGM